MIEDRAKPEVANDARSPLPLVRIDRLRLVDFRNHRGLDLRFDRPFVVFHGANGAGKTNLLEAISLLTPGRGLRRAPYPDVAGQNGAGGFRVEAHVTSRDGESVIATRTRREAEGTGRSVTIDATEAKSADELLDLLRVVWLTPAMDGLFTGPAGDRRRFLDRMVLAVDPAHGRRAADYEKAMRARNRLLTAPRPDPSWLDGLEAQMAELGVAIAIARRELVGLLAGLIDARDDAGPFPKADLALASGISEVDWSRPSGQIEDALLGALAAGRAADTAAGRTLEGPHRADLHVRHRAKHMPAALSSTGEQKALLVGLVLAHARLVADLSGLPPILLLDEIAAHLDAARRAALFDLIEGLGVQAFLTGTDGELFAALGDRAQMLHVSADGVGAPT